VGIISQDFIARNNLCNGPCKLLGPPDSISPKLAKRARCSPVLEYGRTNTTRIYTDTMDEAKPHLMTRTCANSDGTPCGRTRALLAFLKKDKPSRLQDPWNWAVAVLHAEPVWLTLRSKVEATRAPLPSCYADHKADSLRPTGPFKTFHARARRARGRHRPRTKRQATKALKKLESTGINWPSP